GGTGPQQVDLAVAEQLDTGHRHRLFQKIGLEHGRVEHAVQRRFGGPLWGRGLSFAAGRGEPAGGGGTGAQKRAAREFVGVHVGVPFGRSVRATVAALRTVLAPHLARIPNSGGYVPIAIRLVLKVIDGHDHAVASLGTARIAEVTAAAFAAQRDLLAPGLPAVLAQAGANPIGGRATAISQAHAPVRQADQACRVALAEVGRRNGVQPPACCVVNGAVGFDPVLLPLVAANRGQQLLLAQPNRRGHNRVPSGLVAYPRDELPGAAAVGGAHAKRPAL